jgi:hypothetical protein
MIQLPLDDSQLVSAHDLLNGWDYLCSAGWGFRNTAGSVHTVGADWAKATLDRTWAGRPDPADPADFERTLEIIQYITRLAEELMIDG